ncbi:uncharacterized protein G2W53_029518 [Senna tora]|uniref:Uncharacterized protein n=1 Tax=Senna tora TaxID=362788 RepID=A0A834TE91_9FABA|nr:uncharacterized protein G2W53_029518 [Senna tora]
MTKFRRRRQKFSCRRRTTVWENKANQRRSSEQRDRDDSIAEEAS